MLAGGLLLAVGFVGACVYILRDTWFGDPTIYLIYAKRFWEDQALSFNPGTFSSGASSPLWPIILSPAFAFASFNTAARIIGALVFVLGVVTYIRAARALRLGRAAIAVGASLITYYFVLPSVFLYETPLTLVVGSLNILYLASSGAGHVTPRSRWGYLGWVALVAFNVLTRPEMLIALLSMIAVLSCARKDRVALASGLVVGLALASSYYLYSYLATGAFMASGQARMFASMERAASVGAIGRWVAQLTTVTVFPMALVAPLAVLAVWLSPDRRARSLAVYGNLSYWAYLLVSTVAFPGAAEFDRYVLPFLPGLVYAAMLGVHELGEQVSSSRPAAVGAGAAVVAGFLCLLPLVTVFERAVNLSRRGYSFNEIVEVDLVRHLNATVEEGATVLLYEVQDRLYLRPDIRVVSLDGITDGLVIPYAKSHRMDEFLKAVRPRWWVANDAVYYRPFLRESLLYRVFDETSRTVGARVTVSGITFENTLVRDGDPPYGFAGWRAVYKLSYEASGAATRSTSRTTRRSSGGTRATTRPTARSSL